MSLFFFLFIIFIVWCLLHPIIRVWTTVRQAQKQANDFFSAASGGTRQSGSRRKENRSQQRRRPRKKIDPNVGEYVEFEEISVYSSTNTYQEREVKFTPEQQIEDAEWEDIK